MSDLCCNWTNVKGDNSFSALLVVALFRPWCYFSLSVVLICNLYWCANDLLDIFLRLLLNDLGSGMTKRSYMIFQIIMGKTLFAPEASVKYLQHGYLNTTWVKAKLWECEKWNFLCHFDNSWTFQKFFAIDMHFHNRLSQCKKISGNSYFTWP